MSPYPPVFSTEVWLIQGDFSSGVGSMGAMETLDPIDKIPGGHGPHVILYFLYNRNA